MKYESNISSFSQNKSSKNIFEVSWSFTHLVMCFLSFFGNIIANITPVDTFVASIHPFWASKKCQDAYSVPTRYQDHNLGKKNSQHCLGWSASHFQSLPAEVFHLLGVCFWGPIIYIYTWNPNDPCFAWTGPCFGGFNPQHRGQTGSRYIYIYLFDVWCLET